MKLYKRTDCEVSRETLRKRLMAGEDYSTAKKLRNFKVAGKTYSSLWAFSKDIKNLTYKQLLYRIAVKKMTPKQAISIPLTSFNFMET